MSSWTTIQEHDIGSCIGQILGGDAEEIIDLTFDCTAAALSRTTNEDDNDDDDNSSIDSDDDNFGGSLYGVGSRNNHIFHNDDPESSLLTRINAHRILNHPAIKRRNKHWRVKRDLQELSYYINDDTNHYFGVDEEDAWRFQIIDGRSGAGGWLKPNEYSGSLMKRGADQLDYYFLPHVKPDGAALRSYMVSSSSLVGASTANVHLMSDIEIQNLIKSSLDPTLLNAACPITAQAVGFDGLTWSDQQIAQVYPVQAASVQDRDALRKAVIDAVDKGKLPEKHIEECDAETIEIANVLFAPDLKLEGAPSAHGRIRGQLLRDVDTYKKLSQGNSKMAKALRRFLFPRKTSSSSNLSWQTFYMYQIADFFVKHAAMSPEQALIGMGVYFGPNFLCDIPKFGVLLHILIQGAPGLGKTYLCKLLLEILSAARTTRIHSKSSKANTYESDDLKTQVVNFGDEHQFQNDRGSTDTLQEQSLTEDGVVSHARADAKEKKTRVYTKDGRINMVQPANKGIPGPLQDRQCMAANVPPRQTSLKATPKKSRFYDLLTIGTKIMTGLTSAIALNEMYFLFEYDYTLVDIFCQLHMEMYEDSILKKGRKADQLKKMALACTRHNLSAWYHRKEKHEDSLPKEDFSIDFLKFLMVNAVIDPYAVMLSAMCQLNTGDPSIETKVLRWLKNNMKKTAKNSVEFTQDGQYFFTTLQVNDARMEKISADLGLGQSLLEQALTSLTMRNTAAEASLKLEQSGRHMFYAVHKDAVATMRTLNIIEEVIVKHLVKCRNVAKVSKCLKFLVFPSSVRDKITKSTSRLEALANVAEEDLEMALSSLEKSLGISLYMYSGSVRKLREKDYICTVDPKVFGDPLPGALKAPPGSALDPDANDDVYYHDTSSIDGAIVFHYDKLQEYLSIITGDDPALIKAAEKEEQLANVFLGACGARLNERVIKGFAPQDSDEVIMWHTVGGSSVPFTITNPNYCGKTSSFGEEDDDDMFLPPTQKHISLKFGDNLFYKLCQRRKNIAPYDCSTIPIVAQE